MLWGGGGSREGVQEGGGVTTPLTKPILLFRPAHGPCLGKESHSVSHQEVPQGGHKWDATLGSEANRACYHRLISGAGNEVCGPLLGTPAPPPEAQMPGAVLRGGSRHMGLRRGGGHHDIHLVKLTASPRC